MNFRNRSHIIAPAAGLFRTHDHVRLIGRDEKITVKSGFVKEFCEKVAVERRPGSKRLSANLLAYS
jgi:hypothetical protein